jgi:two-component system phosphate regulon response regulator PhoB
LPFAQQSRHPRCNFLKAVSDAASALKIKRESVKLVLLDWMLPGMSGLEFLKVFNRDTAAGPPILMVTARSDAGDIIEGLNAGADDYLVKPFEMAVLSARVRALLRRASGLDREEAVSGVSEIRIDGLVIHPESHEVFCENVRLKLTVSEFKLLAVLARNRGRVLTRKSLVREVQGEGISVVDRTIDTHVFGLRKKLGRCQELIETIRAVGYRVRL